MPLKLKSLTLYNDYKPGELRMALGLSNIVTKVIHYSRRHDYFVQDKVLHYVAVTVVCSH